MDYQRFWLVFGGTEVFPTIAAQCFAISLKNWMIFLDFFLLSSQFCLKISNFFFEKTQNPTENRVFCKIKTETQPKPVLQKPKPNRNLKFSEKPNRHPTRPWVEDTVIKNVS
jgi:hypothetical protein